MQNEISSFEEYSNSRIFSRLADIRGFALTVDIPPIGMLVDDLFARRLVARLYDESLRDVVRAAGFFFEDELQAVREAGGVGVRYADDRFAFLVGCTPNTIIISREGSRLSNFHNWYTAFMPSAQGVLTKVATILTEETNRRIDILRAGYRFNFLIYDICSETTNKRVRNSEIIQKLLKGFPDDQGMITDSPHVLESLGRVDVSMMRWIGDEGNRRRLGFSVEAPGNLGYSSLWFTFSYLGESYTSPETDEREAFDPNTFLSEYVEAYVSFLRDSAINGFMEWLLRGYHFKSTAGDLP